MARLVTKFKYLKPDQEKPIGGYATYIATREGVEKIDESFKLAPATVKQQKLIEKILRDFSDSAAMLEYEDYQREKTVGAASEFITRAIEDNAHEILKGKLRAIGVSNFYPDRLIDLCQFAEIAPMVNQVETHVFQQQRTAHEYMKKYGVQHEAWGPFAEGKKNCFTNPVLVEIGEKYGKTAAQTALRFLIQSDVVVIPKSTHKERMEQNLDVFDFSLSEADMEAIRTLDEGKSLFFDHYDPSTVEMLTNMGKTRIV